MHMEREAQDLDCLKIKLGELKEQLPFPNILVPSKAVWPSLAVATTATTTHLGIYFLHTFDIATTGKKCQNSRLSLGNFNDCFNKMWQKPSWWKSHGGLFGSSIFLFFLGGKWGEVTISFSKFLDASGLSFRSLYPCCGIFHYGMWASLQLWCAGSRVCGLCSLQHRDSVVVVHGLGCPIACRIKTMSPALEGIFITTGPRGKSWLFYSWHHPSPNQRTMLHTLLRNKTSICVIP